MGSRRWASKPAETSSHVGAKPATRGASTSSMAGRYTSPVAPAGSGKFTVVPMTLAGAGLGERAGAGVERPLVERHVHHARVAVEDVLRAVAVVGVVVDDEHPLAPVGQRARPRRPRCSGGRSPSRESGGVVAGRAHGAERRRRLAPRRGPRRRQPGAGGQAGGVPGLGAGPVVSASMRPPPGRAERARWRRGRPAGCTRSSSSRVAAGARRARGRRRDRPSPGAGEHRLEASGTFGMPVAGLVIEVARVRREDDGHCVEATVSAGDQPLATGRDPTRPPPALGSRRGPAAGRRAPRRDRQGAGDLGPHGRGGLPDAAVAARPSRCRHPRHRRHAPRRRRGRRRRPQPPARGPRCAAVRRPRRHPHGVVPDPRRAGRLRPPGPLRAARGADPHHEHPLGQRHRDPAPDRRRVPGRDRHPLDRSQRGPGTRRHLPRAPPVDPHRRAPSCRARLPPDRPARPPARRHGASRRRPPCTASSCSPTPWRPLRACRSR